jgi:hypothetical protein
MSNLAHPAGQAEEQDATAYALGGWGRTARLCAIRLAGSAPAPIAAFVIWLCSRR